MHGGRSSGALGAAYLSSIVRCTHGFCAFCACGVLSWALGFDLAVDRRRKAQCVCPRIIPRITTSYNPPGVTTTSHSGPRDIPQKSPPDRYQQLQQPETGPHFLVRTPRTSITTQHHHRHHTPPRTCRAKKARAGQFESVRQVSHSPVSAALAAAQAAALSCPPRPIICTFLWRSRSTAVTCDKLETRKWLSRAQFLSSVT